MDFNDLKNFDLDLKKKFNKNYIAYYDECGRGSICGPFVAAVCVIDDVYFNNQINDSKKVLEKNRDNLAKEIKGNSIFWGIVEFSNIEIDELGIQIINKKAFEELHNTVKFDSLLNVIDGNIMSECNWCFSIEKGDSKSFGIACASIIAKVHRDNLMVELSRLYPGYNLENNKGYGEDYISKVKELGVPSTIHRHSYKIKSHEQIKLF